MPPITYDVEDEVEDMEEGGEEAEAPASSRLKSTISGAGAVGSGKKQKGRGFKDGAEPDRYQGGKFESLESGTGPGPAKSIEGWIIMVTGVHEEAQEDDLHEAFGEYGEIKNLHLNLDRRTGFVKGYAMLEYEKKQEAQAAIDALDGTELLEQTIQVSFAFAKGPLKKTARK